MRTPIRLAAGMTALALAIAGPGRPAAAHPHVWIESSADMLFDAQGRVHAVRVLWRFDELYSAFAIQGADQDRDGKTTPDELRAVAADNVKFLKEWNYFTYLKVDGVKATLGDVTDYGNANRDGVLEFSFVLPLAEPADPRRHRIGLASYDPSYYVAFENDPARPSLAEGPIPDNCRVAAYGPDEAPQQVADQLAASLTQDSDWAAQYAPVVRVECAG